MQTVMECVSEALSLDSQGSTKQAVTKYLECLDMVIHGPVDAQSRVIAGNCLDRLHDLCQLLPSPEGADSASKHHSNMNSTHNMHNMNNMHSSTTNMDVVLSSLRRTHENEQLSHESRRPPSLGVAPEGKEKPQSLFQQRIKELLVFREARRSRMGKSRVLEWMRLAFASLDLSSLSTVLSRPPFNIVSVEEKAILEALGGHHADALPRAIVLFLSSRKEHPVVCLADDFVKRLFRMMVDQEQPSNRHQEIADDIHLFSRHFLGWFEQQWNLPPGKFSSEIELGLQEYILGTSIYPMLMDLYKNDCGLLNQRMCQLGWEKLMDAIGLSIPSAALQDCYQVFPVCRDPEIFAAALANLAQIPASRTPSIKLDFLLKACSELSRSFPNDEVGGEELMRLLALALVRSPVGGAMAVEAAFIADLVPESILMGESGYVLATLQSSMDYILQL